jgi:hypothetical protein
MGHLVSTQLWGVLDLDTTKGIVVVRQDWHYTWNVVAPASAWTLAEKRHFHNTLDRQIWGQWSNRLRIYPSGHHDLARRFGVSGMQLTFDVRWVTRSGQWSVNVRKLVPGGSYVSNVDFANRVIELDSEDLTPHAVVNKAGQQASGFRTVPHEFGHALGTANKDEYKKGSPYLADTKSILNIGRQVRSRHAQLVVDTLHRLVPTCTFRAA